MSRDRAQAEEKQTKALGTKAGYISGLEAYGLDNGSPLCWRPGCLGVVVVTGSPLTLPT